jgi:hypothetical protein
MTKKPKLTRKQIAEGLKATPIETILLGANNAKEKRLTASQIKFAEEIAKGKTKAEAYRLSRPNGRKSNAKPKTASQRGQELSKDGAIQAQIEAFKVALEAQKYQTPLHLRALAIHKITEKALDPNVPPAQQLKALELLGKITEVALFTERREVVQHTTSDQMKEKLLTSLRLAIKSSTATDAKDLSPESLLAELTAKPIDREITSDFMSDNDQTMADPDEILDGEGLINSKSAEPTDPQPPKIQNSDSDLRHSIPHTLPPKNNEPLSHKASEVDPNTVTVSTQGKPLEGGGGIEKLAESLEAELRTPPVTDSGSHA